MADAKQEVETEQPKFMYSWQSEAGEKQEVDAQTFGNVGKKAYQKLADLSKKKDDLIDATQELDVLINFYNQVIQQNEINPPVANGEDTTVEAETKED